MAAAITQGSWASKLAQQHHHQQTNMIQKKVCLAVSLESQQAGHQSHSQLVLTYYASEEGWILYVCSLKYVACSSESHLETGANNVWTQWGGHGHYISGVLKLIMCHDWHCVVGLWGLLGSTWHHHCCSSTTLRHNKYLMSIPCLMHVQVAWSLYCTRHSPIRWHPCFFLCVCVLPTGGTLRNCIIDCNFKSMMCIE